MAKPFPKQVKSIDHDTMLVGCEYNIEVAKDVLFEHWSVRPYNESMVEKTHYVKFYGWNDLSNCWAFMGDEDDDHLYYEADVSDWLYENHPERFDVYMHMLDDGMKHLTALNMGTYQELVSFMFAQINVAPQLAVQINRDKQGQKRKLIRG